MRKVVNEREKEKDSVSDSQKIAESQVTVGVPWLHFQCFYTDDTRPIDCKETNS